MNIVVSTLQSAGKSGGWRVDAEGAAEGHPVAFHQTQDPISETNGSTPALGRTSIGMGISSIAQGVRRLTPKECERLQGFPDDWTLIAGAPDSRRYAAMGDAVTVPVAEWIGWRIRDFGLI